jgi:hypothetical protein
MRKKLDTPLSKITGDLSQIETPQERYDRLAEEKEAEVFDDLLRHELRNLYGRERYWED